jgi:hypothetical protein
MPQYLFAYHGGHTPESEEEGKLVMAQWMAWFGGMGDAVVQPGAPVGLSRIVSNLGVADNDRADPTTGYFVVIAGNIDAATKMAQGCPMVIAGNGFVEVAELVEM